MKKHYKLAVLFSAAAGIVLMAGCNKDQVKPAVTATDQSVSSLPATHDGLHVYGLLPASDAEIASMPVYNQAQFNLEHRSLDAKTAAPSSLTLVYPAVRDQGQLGACTGFAGTEAYEITYNYTH